MGSQRVGHTSDLARMHLHDYGIVGERKSEQACHSPSPHHGWDKQGEGQPPARGGQHSDRDSSDHTAVKQ